MYASAPIKAHSAHRSSSRRSNDKSRHSNFILQTSAVAQAAYTPVHQLLASHASPSSRAVLLHQDESDHDHDDMPPKASEVAVETKRIYVPLITNHIREKQREAEMCRDNDALELSALRRWTLGSVLIADSAILGPFHSLRDSHNRPSVAVIEGDPIDVSLQWQKHPACTRGLCPLVNPAHGERAGGDWEMVTMGPEECLARRSNLCVALKTTLHRNAPVGGAAHYPIPRAGGLYTPCVVVYRNGPDDYTVYGQLECLPVISVPPVKKPRLDRSGKRYAFQLEKEDMRQRMRSVLRIAAYQGFRDICIGSFGLGSIHRNPPRELAEIWRDLLFRDPEFRQLFKNVIFCFDTRRSGRCRRGSAVNSNGSSSTTGNACHATVEDKAIFDDVFDPRVLYDDQWPEASPSFNGSSSSRGRYITNGSSDLDSETGWVEHMDMLRTKRLKSPNGRPVLGMLRGAGGLLSPPEEEDELDERDIMRGQHHQQRKRSSGGGYPARMLLGGFRSR